ncbi:tripartite tricarboxylate transporter substrate binding protein [soil metagenome]
MNLTTTRRTFVIGLAASMSGAAAIAQEYPNRYIKLVVPYAPGGPADVFSRVLAEMLTKDLGQTLVVENKPGAGTMIGAAIVAQAPADGYTLFQSTSTMVLNPMLYKKLPYDPKAIRPLVIALEAPLVAVVNPKVPATTMREFADYARAQDGKLSYASSGVGNAVHFLPELFKKSANFKMTHVPYNGQSVNFLNAVLSGEVEFLVTVAAQVVPHIKAGTLRALAVTSAQRLDVLPEVPTTTEAGYPELRSATWYGIAIHSGTPEPVAARIRQSIDKAISDEGFRKRFNAMGLVVQAPRTAAEIDVYMASEKQKWEGVIREQNISLD